MKIIDTLYSPWAISSYKYSEICEVYDRRVMQNHKLSAKEIRETLAAMDHPMQQPGEMSTHGNVAVIPIHGVMAKKMNLFSAISGGTSMELVAKDLQIALDDEDIDTVILDIDSPGGTVFGTEALGDAVFAAKDKLHIIALANDVMASAAYWVGSAAHEVFASGKSSVVGSIGVMMRHVDSTKAEQDAGVKTTILHAGEFKTVGAGELTDRDSKVIQAQLDESYALFIDTVARNRDVSAQLVKTDMAEGRVFSGTQAVKAGLVDGISTLDALIAKHQHTGENNDMDLKFLKANHPELVAELLALGVASVDIMAIEKAAVVAEQARITSILSMPGAKSNEKLVTAMVFDGKSSKGDVALALLDYQESARQSAKSSVESDAAELLDVVPSASATGSEIETQAKHETDDEAPLEIRANKAWNSDKKLREEFQNDKDSYLAYMTAHEAGLIRTLTTKSGT